MYTVQHVVKVMDKVWLKEITEGVKVQRVSENMAKNMRNAAVNYEKKKLDSVRKKHKEIRDKQNYPWTSRLKQLW